MSQLTPGYFEVVVRWYKAGGTPRQGVMCYHHTDWAAAAAAAAAAALAPEATTRYIMGMVADDPTELAAKQEALADHAATLAGPLP